MTTTLERVNKHYKKYPWLKHLQYSRQRARKKGWVHTLNKDEIKLLWDRDKANKLKAPSIDRVDPSKGYSLKNCRFIERSENSRLGVLGRPTTDKQRETASRNLGNWVRNNPPWNKGKKPKKKNCAFCGSEFQPKRSGRIMCSPTCTAKNASRARSTISNK